MSTAAPQFVERDPAAVVASLVDQYQTMTGRTLYPAQVERLLIDLVAYRESLTRELIQDTALQNLVSFARAPFLDHLGELMGVTRLPASAAYTTVRLAFAEPLAAAVTLPAGWRAALPSGLQFAAEAAVSIPAGALAIEFGARTLAAGTSANGWAASALEPVDTLPAAATVTSTVVSRGGMEAESDDRYRLRVRQAPETFSWGSEGRYRMLALATAPTLRDVRVLSPRPDGSVTVVLLGSDGVPGAEVVAAVQAALDHPRARMLGDRVAVYPATPVDYALRVEVDVAPDQVSDLVLANVTARLRAWADQQANRLGGDLVPARIVAAAGGATGVYDLRVLEPLQRVLQAHEWPRLTGIAVTLGRQVADD